MTVKEVIEELQQMPQDETVIMFDGLFYYTPNKIYVIDDSWNNRIHGKVMIN